MHIIYRLINRRKEKSNEFPCYYIGSKTNYVKGKYWGSSHYPLLKEELRNSKEDFEMEILAEVVDVSCITSVERDFQIKLNVMHDKSYYNLQLANEKFTAAGRKWYHDPITMTAGLFTTNKVPPGWAPGYKKESDRSTNSLKAAFWKENPTGLKKDDPELHKKISDSMSNFEWTLRDPLGKLHMVKKLHQFCKDNKLSIRLRLDSNFNIPIKKGASKGWCVIRKKIIGDKPLL